MEQYASDDESLGACGGGNYKLSKNGKSTPDYFYASGNLLDSGYSSLPPSPSPQSFDGSGLRRKSLSLECCDSSCLEYSELSPIKKKPYVRHRFRAENDDTKLEINFDSLLHRRESTLNNQITSSPVPFAADLLPSFDILSELTPYFLVIERIFSFLDGKDLSSVCCVSKTWRRLCKSDKCANKKRKEFLELIAINKENPFSRRQRPSKSVIAEYRRIKTPLAENQPREEVRSAPALGTFQRYVEVGHLPEVVKCLSCSSPSNVLNKSSSLAICTKSSCSHRFCYLCRNTYIEGHKCKIVNRTEFETPTTRACGRKCRQRLLRLALP